MSIQAGYSNPLPMGNCGEVHILLVEDNKLNQKVAMAILHKEGYVIDIAENGLEAINQINKAHYHAILMDCQMPVMDGFEATRQIRQMPSPVCKTPIIAITAYAMTHDRDKCLNSGMDDYLSKPVNRQQLLDIVKHYTSAPSAYENE